MTLKIFIINCFKLGNFFRRWTDYKERVNKNQISLPRVNQKEIVKIDSDDWLTEEEGKGSTRNILASFGHCWR